MDIGAPLITDGQAAEMTKPRTVGIGLNFDKDNGHLPLFSWSEVEMHV